jgi:PAS domain S-box-containing protein
VLPERQSSFEEVLAALSKDPDLREFARPDSALLLWDLEGRLVWASPAAGHLRDALSQDDDGRAGDPLPARAQLRALGQGLAPAQGVRLERLRFDSNRLVPPVTCACRRITLPSGEGALLTAIVGPIPKLARAGSARSGRTAYSDRSPTEGFAQGDPMNGRAEPPALRPSPPRQRGTVRFVWHTDAFGRFTYRSESMAEVVGTRGAAIVGRKWDEIAGELVVDPDGAVAEAFARTKTWSGHTVLWRVDGTGHAVAIELAGAPVFGRDREFQGFRGFGLCRPDADLAWPSGRPRAAGTTKPEAARLSEPVVAVRTPAQPRDEAPALSREQRPHEHRSLSHLSEGERAAFREIARALGARFDHGDVPADPARPGGAEIVPVFAREAVPPQTLAILDRLPVGILVCHGRTPLFANRVLLDVSGYDTVGALADDGGLARLLPGHSPHGAIPDEPVAFSTLLNSSKHSLPVELRVASAQWGGVPATVLIVRALGEHDSAPRLRALELDLRASEARLRELNSVLDTATDGIVMMDSLGRVLSLNRSAEALFGYDQREIAGERMTMLLAPESHKVLEDYFDALRVGGVKRVFNDGREMLGRVRQGGTIPLFVTIGRAGEEPDAKFCAVLCDITAVKKAEAELLDAKRAADEANAAKADLLAKVSHEVRTPLNAIIGFAEVMLEERFGRLGNERYRDYLKDMHESGRNVLGLVSDLLDLANIAAGRMELSFKGVSLNEIVAACVSAQSQHAARERIVVRTSFAPTLPAVVADERSIRQIVDNIVSNAVQFTVAGGQVIVSTAATDRGEVVIRVRDTGFGMTEQEIAAALEPFRQLATAGKGSGTGLGLPLTKALVDANRAMLHITSARDEGTLVEVVFPPTRVLAG